MRNNILVPLKGLKGSLLPGILLAPQTKDLSLFQNLSLNICKLSNYCMKTSDTRAWIYQFLNTRYLDTASLASNLTFHGFETRAYFELFPVCAVYIVWKIRTVMTSLSRGYVFRKDIDTGKNHWPESPFSLLKHILKSLIRKTINFFPMASMIVN